MTTSHVNNSPLHTQCCQLLSGKILSSTVKNSYRTILNIQRNRPKNPNTRKIGIKRDLQNPYCLDKIRNFGSTAYVTVDDAVRLLTTLVKDALMAKADLRAAFRNIPINLADCDHLGTWGHLWQGKRIRFNCDDLTIVRAWNGMSARHPALNRLFRRLFLTAAQNQFTVSLKHLPGKSNALTDALSRNQLTCFFSLFPRPTTCLPNYLRS